MPANDRLYLILRLKFKDRKCVQMASAFHPNVQYSECCLVTLMGNESDLSSSNTLTTIAVMAGFICLKCALRLL